MAAKDSGIMGEGSIDGRGGAKLLGQDVTWWDLAHEAKVTDKQQSVPVAHFCATPTLHDVQDHAAQLSGLPRWSQRNRWLHRVGREDHDAQDRAQHGRHRSWLLAQRDDHALLHSHRRRRCCRQVQQGGPSSNISILHNHFYTGHGMSIGSGTNGGVDHMLVDDLTIDGADNGIRIKSDRSRGGLVHDLLYRDVCIRNTRIRWSSRRSTPPSAAICFPVYRDITLKMYMC
jgi:polygalacturonase